MWSLFLRIMLQRQNEMSKGYKKKVWAPLIHTCTLLGKVNLRQGPSISWTWLLQNPESPGLCQVQRGNRQGRALPLRRLEEPRQTHSFHRHPFSPLSFITLLFFLPCTETHANLKKTSKESQDEHSGHSFISWHSLETTITNWPGSDSNEVVRWDEDCLWFHPTSLDVRNQKPGWCNDRPKVRSTRD